MTNSGRKKSNSVSSALTKAPSKNIKRKGSTAIPSSSTSSSQASAAGLTSVAVSAAEVNAMAIAASLGLPIIDPVKKDIPDNLKSVIKDLMEISSGIVSDNKNTKQAAVAAMKKKFSELGLFSWLDIADDGTMRSKPGMSISSTKAQIAASLGPNTHLPISPDDLPKTIQAIAQSIDFKDLDGGWYVDAEYEGYDEVEEIETRPANSKNENVECNCRNGSHDINLKMVPEDDDDDDSDLEYLYDNESHDLKHIDPVKYQVVQTARHEFNSICSLFDSDMCEDEKLSVLKNEYMKLMHQDIRHRLDGLRAKESVQAMEVERDSIKRDLDKMNKLKAKLESLCIELQEENRKIKAEALKRLETHNQLQLQQQQASKCKLKSGCPRCGCILDLNTAFPSLPDLPEVPSLQKAGAKTLSEQLHKFVDIYRLRERHFDALIKAKEVEVDIQLAKSMDAELKVDQMKQKVDSYERQISSLTRAEQELKSQLAIYVDKFKQVEETLGKSNDLFATFRREMEQMTAKLSRLESENHQLTTKCNTLSRNIIEMADERTKSSANYEALKAQKGKLEQLCRTLQAERKSSTLLPPSSNNNNNSNNN